jgi:hypothetical protein
MNLRRADEAAQAFRRSYRAVSATLSGGQPPVILLLPFPGTGGADPVCPIRLSSSFGASLGAHVVMRLWQLLGRCDTPTSSSTGRIADARRQRAGRITADNPPSGASEAKLYALPAYVRRTLRSSLGRRERTFRGTAFDSRGRPSKLPAMVSSADVRIGW